MGGGAIAKADKGKLMNNDVRNRRALGDIGNQIPSKLRANDAKQPTRPVNNEVRNWRALGDIGNQIPSKLKQPTHPVTRTRSFYPKLIANGQEENHIMKAAPLNAIPVKRGVVLRKPQRKVHAKPNPGTVIGISKHDPNVANNKAEVSAKKKATNTLTSVLSARSKLACEIPKKQRLDIDAGDQDNELAVVEYVEDIYKFYKLAEVPVKVAAAPFPVTSKDFTPVVKSRSNQMAMSRANLKLVANTHKLKIIVGVSVVVIIALAATLAYKLYHHGGDHINSNIVPAPPSLTLTSFNSTTWHFSLQFSDPNPVHGFLAVSPMLSYYNTTTTTKLNNAIIGNRIPFHPDSHQASFSGFLPLDSVSHDVSPFLLAQQASGTLHAAVSVALSVDDSGVVYGWVCLAILRTPSSSSPSSKCSPANLVS